MLIEPSFAQTHYFLFSDSLLLSLLLNKVYSRRLYLKPHSEIPFFYTGFVEANRDKHEINALVVIKVFQTLQFICNLNMLFSSAPEPSQLD